ncbi:TetR/AcrR family transcriptional regulator [Streptomyces hygroscopicus]|uniref:TetR/AcrR family transcriptional regulator n=1 Tax=Streptomyces hygroscopicus TaxID=1912 RepID=UPI00368E446F
MPKATTTSQPERKPTRKSARKPERKPGQKPEQEPERQPERSPARQSGRNAERESERRSARKPERQSEREPARKPAPEPGRQSGRKPERKPARKPGPGLRERKKIKTRQAIRRAALRLFAEQGYEATPVDRIAAAADVSTSTVFRYFPAKEDIVLTDEYDVLMAEAIRERPPDEPPAVSLRHAVVGLLGPAAGAEREELLVRLALVQQVPTLRARMSGGLADNGVLLGEVLAERSGRAPDDFEVRVVVGAILGALREAVFHCLERRLAQPTASATDEAGKTGKARKTGAAARRAAGSAAKTKTRTSGNGTDARDGDEMAAAIDRALDLLTRGLPL